MKRLHYYIISTCIDILIVIACMVGINYLTTNSIVSNEIALKQMENSNEAFMEMEVFTAYRNGFVGCMGIVTVVFCIGAAIHIYKIIKEIKGE